MDPNQQEIFMEYIEHWMEAVGRCQLRSMGSYSKEEIGVDINVTYIQPALMLINIVDFSQIKNCLSFVYS